MLQDRLRPLLGPTAGHLEAALGLRTVGDLLHHYPRRYDERGRLTSFGDLVVGEHVTVFAEVQHLGGRRIRPKLHKTDLVLRDDSGRTLSATLFNRQWVAKDLRPGRRAYFSGKVERFAGRVQLANPQYQLVDDDDGQVVPEFDDALIPVYPASERVSSGVLRRCVELALQAVGELPDPLPPALRLRLGLISLTDAIRTVHQPETLVDVERARRRLIWDEAFLLQVILVRRRERAKALLGTARPGRAGGLLDRFDAGLPFELTGQQAEVGGILAGELARTQPMHRLLQGEVGSGKTLVALRAMLRVIDSGGQAALLAPTEVLAHQHARTIRALLGPLGTAGELGEAEGATSVTVLTGSQGAAARRRALEQAASGSAGIVIGTHALLGEGVEFADLGLVVIDEQHRFGVEQRDALRAKGAAPHVLVLTATPIPRTVAITAFGDLDVSTMTELPRGRRPVRTHVVPAGEPRWMERVWQRIVEAAGRGEQSFVVCPRVGGDVGGDVAEGETPTAAVSDWFPLLAGGPLAGLRLAALHGRLPAEEKEAVMRAFSRGELDVLVATTVIEVGVDVPTATVMVVLDAERFGISQLHQLRGRIGRGDREAVCLLVTGLDEGTPGRERLEAVAATQDGFALSRLDLLQRREGDVLGSAQSGVASSLRILRLDRDEQVIVAARDEAAALLAADPDLRAHPVLLEAVDQLAESVYLEKA